MTYKPGDLVRIKHSNKLTVVSQVRGGGRVAAYYHLEGFSPQRVFHADDIRLVK